MTLTAPTPGAPAVGAGTGSIGGPTDLTLTGPTDGRPAKMPRKDTGPTEGRPTVGTTSGFVRRPGSPLSGFHEAASRLGKLIVQVPGSIPPIRAKPFSSRNPSTGFLSGGGLDSAHAGSHAF